MGKALFTKALLWEKSGDKGAARCLLCARGCLIEDGERGFCQVRANEGGELLALNYGCAAAAALDPVEKKPLYHYLPGSFTFSLGAPGCNFDCLGCQNHSLSRPGKGFKGALGERADPESLVSAALASGAKSMSFTYSEPTVFYEYARDAGLLAMERGLPSIFVTNGFMSRKAMDGLDFVKAMNIDLKGFTEEFYKKVTGGRLGPVKDSIKEAFKRGIFVEVTTLLIPELNDGERELDALAAFLASVSEDLPWHISRFHPQRKQSHLSATPLGDLLRAREAGRRNGLRHVYIGNAEGKGFGDTVCPSCKEALVTREGFRIRKNLVKKNGRCPKCDASIPGVWG
jgi:pyruvate formate lyase activating enzyme